MKSISINLVLFWLLGSIAQAQLQNNYSQYEVTRLRDISLKGTSISILALNGFGFEISTVSDKFVYKGFSLALSSDSVYKMNIFTDFKLGKELINGWTPYLTMGINYSAKYDTSNSFARFNIRSIIEILMETSNIDVGSSHTTNLGFITSVLAIETLCLCPPEIS